MENINRNHHRHSNENIPCILIADDNKEMCSLLSHSLNNLGFKTIECSNGWELLDYLSSSLISEIPEKIDLIITDIRMPGLTGMEILKGLQNEPLFPPIILITAFGNKQIHKTAKQLGARSILNKPFDINVLISNVTEIIKNRKKKEYYE